LAFGVEGEGWWSGLTSTRHFAQNAVDETRTTRNRWDFDVALRAGFALDRAFIYGKVGAAWGRFDFKDATNLGQNSIITTTSDGNSLAGLLVGFGFEYALFPHWTAKLEYSWIDYVHKDATFVQTGPPSTFIESVSGSKHIVKVGVNYLFDFGKAPSPVVARY
jgi:outer membrane immunogenic protein